MPTSSDKSSEQNANETANALYTLAEKTIEKVTGWAKSLMSSIAQKAIDWISYGIKTGVDTLSHQIKIALQPEPLITLESSRTEPAVSAVENVITTSPINSDERLALEKKASLTSHLQPQGTDSNAQLIAHKLSSDSDDSDDGLDSSILTAFPQRADTYNLYHLPSGATN